MRPTQLVGLFLWRAGLLLASSYSLYRVSEIALEYVDLPAQVKVGVSLAAAGAMMVLGSLVAERVVDARAEDFAE